MAWLTYVIGFLGRLWHEALFEWEDDDEATEA